MIGWLSGILLEKQAPELLVDVQGVGYEVQVSLTTYFDLPVCGEPVKLFTHLVVREDVQQLYGFAEQRERKLFRILIKVSGIGPKVALGLLSGMSTDQFVRTIQAEDTATLVKLPGIGKKTAARLIVEVRDRLETFFTTEEEALTAPDSQRFPPSQSLRLAEAESALVALGYKSQKATQLVNAVVVAGMEQTSEDLIRLALKSVARG